MTFVQVIDFFKKLCHAGSIDQQSRLVRRGVFFFSWTRRWIISRRDFLPTRWEENLIIFIFFIFLLDKFLKSVIMITSK